MWHLRNDLSMTEVMDLDHAHLESMDQELRKKCGIYGEVGFIFKTPIQFSYMEIAEKLKKYDVGL